LPACGMLCMPAPRAFAESATSEAPVAFNTSRLDQSIVFISKAPTDDIVAACN
jgi:hypothetical protein